MCGIAGVFRPGGGARAEEELVRAMTRSLAHRGPDDEGFFTDPAIALGHRRLRVIDLSPRGRQPFFSEDGGVVLAFNGEIYNHRALRARLAARGHRFASDSDGEVIVHLYEDEGDGCAAWLEGMFAFALYDRARRRLLLTRDRTGEKPLYYAVADGGLYFASESRALLAAPGLRPSLDPAALLGYFAYTAPPAPYSMFTGVRRVLQGHTLVVSDVAALEERPYWRIDYTRKTEESFDQATDHLDDLLGQVVEETVVSDVPVGVTLSGGVDSSLVLARMAAIGGRSYDSFTLGSADPDARDEELERAAAVADAFRTRHHVLPYQRTSFVDLERAMAAFQEPVGLFDSIHLTYLYDFIRGHSTVVLAGNGGDEVFAGYPTYPGRMAEAAPLQAELDATRDRQAYLIDWVAGRHAELVRDAASRLFGPELEAVAAAHDPREDLTRLAGLARFDRFLDAELFFELMAVLNHTAWLCDVTSMASSVETRAPLLHHRILEYAASLPDDYKVGRVDRPGQDKRILKEVAARYLPREAVFAPKLVCGQFVDWLGTMRTAWARPIRELLFEDARALGWFSMPRIERLWSGFLADRADPADTAALRKLILFLAWHRSLA
ncbi:MAG TPA: asparagine synthase (glutamine-hydrolyzing) [Kofleriaceae bacterium]|nr:asparagine synthase (glutamine-hydrolyzing) [Kofleriaceae bacterium]